jgi:hypothetical protein
MAEKKIVAIGQKVRVFTRPAHDRRRPFPSLR